MWTGFIGHDDPHLGQLMQFVGIEVNRECAHVCQEHSVCVRDSPCHLQAHIHVRTLYAIFLQSTRKDTLRKFESSSKRPSMKAFHRIIWYKLCTRTLLYICTNWHIHTHTHTWCASASTMGAASSLCQICILINLCVKRGRRRFGTIQTCLI